MRDLIDTLLAFVGWGLIIAGVLALILPVIAVIVGICLVGWVEERRFIAQLRRVQRVANL